MADELSSGQFYEPGERYDAATPFTMLSAGLLVLGGLALLAPARAQKQARRRRAFGLFAILVSVAVYLLRPQTAAVETAEWIPAERPAVPEPEPAAPVEAVSEPQEPEPDPEPDELLPAAEAGETVLLDETVLEDETVPEDEVPEPSGWHVIAEAREQGRARVDSSRPFVLIQSDEPEASAESRDHDEDHSEVQPREPVEGVVNRVGLYSRRPDDELLESAEADAR